CVRSNLNVRTFKTPRYLDGGHADILSRQHDHAAETRRSALRRVEPLLEFSETTLRRADSHQGQTMTSPCPRGTILQPGFISRQPEESQPICFSDVLGAGRGDWVGGGFTEGTFAAGGVAVFGFPASSAASSLANCSRARSAYMPELWLARKA